MIGDTLSRLLEYCGASVTRVSHVGDLGLPVALVMAAMEHADTVSSAASQQPPFLTSPYSPETLPSPAQLSELYVFAKRTVDAKGAAADDTAVAQAPCPHAPQACDFSARFRQRVSQLLIDVQLGEAASSSTRKLWTRLVTASQAGYNALFRRLDVSVQERGESTYVAALASIVTELIAKGVAVSSNGAIVVPLAPTSADTVKVPPMVVRKSDGGYLYATIDIAALNQRVAAGYNQIVYVTDSSQSLHFQSLFRVSDGPACCVL